MNFIVIVYLNCLFDDECWIVCSLNLSVRWWSMLLYCCWPFSHHNTFRRCLSKCKRRTKWKSNKHKLNYHIYYKIQQWLYIWTPITNYVLHVFMDMENFSSFCFILSLVHFDLMLAHVHVPNDIVYIEYIDLDFVIFYSQLCRSIEIDLIDWLIGQHQNWTDVLMFILASIGHSKINRY